MTTIDPLENDISKSVATLLDDLIIWRTIGNKEADTRGVSTIQPHGGAWMPDDNSFDRFLFWRTVENNGFQFIEYSMSKTLINNAIQLHFDSSTTVLPNVFVVELPDRHQLCLMFATHIGVYRWILKHPTSSELSQSILAEITDSFLNDRPNFFKFDLQAYGKVTCAYTANQLIYAFHNQMETLILRFDNQYNLNPPQQLVFPKRPTTGLFNFLWNANKSVASNQTNQQLIAAQTTITFGAVTMTILLYENGLLRFLSDQIDTVLHEHDLSNDLSQLSTKHSRKLFLDYCQYETFSDEFVTRLCIVLDGIDHLHVLIYEFQIDRNGQLKFSPCRKKVYSKNLNPVDHIHLPHGSSLTAITCTSNRLLLQFLTNQNKSLLLSIDGGLDSHVRDQFIPLPMDKRRKYVNDDSATIDDIERQLNSPGEFTLDMIKDAFWITFNFNLDEFNQSWTTAAQVLHQLPKLMQSLCNEHCDENSIGNEDRLQILTKFWQNLYSTLIDLRAQALVLLGCRIFDERQLIIVIHKSAVSFYSTLKGPKSFNPRYSRFIRDIEHLLEVTNEETISQIDDAMLEDLGIRERQISLQQITQIQKNLEPIVNNDHLVETLQSIYEKHRSNPINRKETPIWTSKTARRLLVLGFVQLCQEKLDQIERLNKIIPLIFRSNEHQKQILSHRMEALQEKVLPYLQDLSQIYQLLVWLSSCVVEYSPGSVDDRNMFIEHLLGQEAEHQYKTKLGNQSLIEQILTDQITFQKEPLTGENWFQSLTQTVDNILSDLWPSDEFLLTYLPSRQQWSTLDQYCNKLDWFKELNAARQFFRALAFYRSGVNSETATRYLAFVLKELHTDPLLMKIFGKQNNRELFYIEWIRDYLKYFGRSQNTVSFLHESLRSTHSNDIQASIIKVLFQTSLELKNFDDAFWCIQNTTDYLSQKQYTLEYASAICSTTSDQSLYRLRILFQYQRDKLGFIDLELLAFIERNCVEQHPIQKSQVISLYELYLMNDFPLKMAQIMFHYGCSINDLREQKEAFQCALDALKSIQSDVDPTDCLFIYPINREYQSLSPLNSNNDSVRLIGLKECQQKLAIISAIYKLKNERISATIEVHENMHPTQLTGLLTKFHHYHEAQQLCEAFQLNKSALPLVH